MATEPTRLECSLVEAQNALQVQSDRDGRGIRNADGWGIARWRSGRPDVIRSTEPPFADPAFAVEAEATRSSAVLAHVRAATVGDVLPNNVHPFRNGPWAFAHNGTLTAHSALAARLLEGALGTPRGTTDSELIFRWLLGRMPEFGLDPQRPAHSAEALASLLEAAVLDLVRWSIDVPGAEPPLLNLLLSDGKHLAASRWGNTLFWTTRDGVPDCAACGTNHCPDAGASYRAVVVASEPITEEEWTEVPEGTILAIGDRGGVTTRDLLTQAA
jgi:glutamine amidotransferase